MKKTILSIALAATIALAGYQAAEAQLGTGAGPGAGPGIGMMGGPGAGYGRMGATLDEETIKARQQFYQETTDLRRQIVGKQAELRAVLSNQRPDEKKAARLAQELFDLRTEKHQKAQELGIAMPGMGTGMGMGKGRMGRGMMGRGMMGQGMMGPGMGMMLGICPMLDSTTSEDPTPETTPN